ncbi:MAG TPA: ATP-binding protein [Desulfatiglandales bacterium]|nr:ATP-binding protein [Desulfatiglandales bacterium]
MTLSELSIRKKITYGFILILVLVTGTALMTYGIVLQVERKVELVEVIDDFFNTTLELRRFEKNYFLYGQEKDFNDTLFYWQKLADLFELHGGELNNLVSFGQIQNIRQAMLAYKDDMARLYDLRLKSAENTSSSFYNNLQEQVRNNGKLLTDFAERTALTERATIKNLLSTTRTFLIISVMVLVFVSIVLATILGKRVVDSLRLLEGYTKKIAHGEMFDPPVKAVEEEINTLLRAFWRMNRELQTRQRQLVQSEKLAALGTLLAGVAHELNNPLSNISTSAQILNEELEKGDIDFKKNLINQIGLQIDKARDIVRTLLEFSRIKEFKKEMVPLKKLLEDTLRLVRGQMPSEVSIKLEVPADIKIFADKQRMQQVFLNLFKNSLDAVDESGHIWVSAQKNQDPEERLIEIIFKDDGPGIEPDVLEKIFDPFFTTKDVGKGSGLGLFLVHDIIESHGGDLTVESSPGSGTTFVIWLKDEKEEGK